MSLYVTIGRHKIRAYSPPHMMVLAARDVIDALRVSQMYRERLALGGPGMDLQTHYAANHRQYAHGRLAELWSHEIGASRYEPAEVRAELLSADLHPWDAAVIAACLVDPDAAREAL